MRDGEPAPVGRYHRHDRCALCGIRFQDSGPEGLTLVVIKHTRAYGWRCVDSIACLRRRAGERQLELFGT